MNFDGLISALRAFAAKFPQTLDLLDLAAQQEMALWAKWMFWATVASVAISFLAVIGVYFSLSQTRRAIKDTREIGEVQTQAYVHASKAQYGDFNNLIIFCKNGGMTPATHFAVNGSAMVVKRGSVTSSIKFSNHQPKIWSALGAQDELSVAVDVDTATIRAFRNGVRENDDVLLVCGEIAYCTIFNHDHVTQYAFYVDPTSERFRRPTSNLKTYWRIPSMRSRRTGMIKRTANLIRRSFKRIRDKKGGPCTPS